MRTRQVDTAPAVSHRGYSSHNASRQGCRFVSWGPEHGSSRSCLPNFSESPQQRSPQQSSCPRDIASAPSLAQLAACPVGPEARKLHLAVVDIFPPGYLGIFHLRHVHLCLMGCVFQRQGNHRVESWALVLAKILLLWLGTAGLNLLHLK